MTDSASKRWDIFPRAPDDHFARFPDLERLVVQVLYNRKLRDTQAVWNFLNYHWADDNPLGLKGMTGAVERLTAAIIRQEPIAIYGDYDADGVTSTALLVELLTHLGARVRPYIPNRFDEGYGLNRDALTELAAQGTRVVLTVDCGIRAVPEVAHGNSLGLDIIITDHHHVGEEIPAALAAINPRQQDCTYGFKDLAGVGLAFKLAQAMLRSDSLKARYAPQALHEDQFLDLVALGTVADLAPLTGENRKLVARGLQRLNRSLRPGLAELVRRMGGRPDAISTGTIGFGIGPRLNAAGRLDSALAAYRLLVSANDLEAIPLAEQLHRQNQERQRLTQDMVELARQVVLADQGQSPLYFVYHPDFNSGVVGLAASRITEEFYRPSLIASQGPEETRGSARSIAEFHITGALDQCRDLLVRYGGHAAAAGFTVKNKNLQALQERLQHIARQSLDPARLRPTLFIDAEVNLRGVRPQLVEAIAALQPFGIANPTPRFVSRNLTIKDLKAVGAGEHHLRLVLNDGRQNWSAIAFRQGHWAHKLRPSDCIDAVYQLEFNEWNGERRLQLDIQDLRPSS